MESEEFSFISDTQEAGHCWDGDLLINLFKVEVEASSVVLF